MSIGELAYDVCYRVREQEESVGLPSLKIQKRNKAHNDGRAMKNNIQLYRDRDTLIRCMRRLFIPLGKLIVTRVS